MKILGRRQFFEVAGKGAIGTALLVAEAGTASFVLTGCPATSVAAVLQELYNWIPTAIVAFDGVVKLVDTTLTAIGATVDVAWAVLQTAVSNYQHTTDPTTTMFDKIIAALDAVEASMTQIIAALPPGIPAAVLAAAQIGFALLLATLKDINGKLNPNPTAPQAAIHAASRVAMVALPTVAPATSVKDFVTKFNAAMAANGQALRVK